MSLLLLALFACAPKHESVAVTHHEAAPSPAPAPVVVEEKVAEEDLLVPSSGLTAIAQLEPGSGSGVGGAVAFTQSEKTLKVAINLTGAAPGTHVLRLRDGGSCTFSQPAAGPQIEDLAVVTATDDGLAHADITLTNLSLSDGDDAVLGKVVIVDDGQACGVVVAAR